MATLTLGRDIALASRESSRSTWPRELSIVLLGVALQATYFTGVIASDDLNYLRLAQAVRDGQPIPSELHYFVGRFVHWLPIQWSITLFPHRIWALALPCWLATVTTCALLWWSARRWMPRSQVWIPPLLFVLTPLVVLNASVAVPDPVAGLLAWAGVFLAMQPLLEPSVRGAAWRCALAGLLIAMGHNAKEWVLLFVPGLCLFTIVSQVTQPAWWRFRRMAWIILGAGCWLAAEMFAYWCWIGDPLFHVRAAQQALRDAGQVVNLDPRSLLVYWTEYLRWLADPTTETGLIGPILLASTMAACIWRSPQGNLLLCCLLPALAYLSMGSSEIRSYFPVCHQHRYLVPLIPGMAMLAGLMIARLVRTPRISAPRWLTYGICVAGILASLAAPGRFAGQWYQASTFTAGVRLLRQLDVRPGESVLASGLTANRFRGAADWLGLPRVDVIADIPQSTAEWQARYAGRYVLVTSRDRQESVPTKHEKLVLTGQAYRSLSGFPCVGSGSDTVKLYSIPPLRSPLDH